ncbi:hypothetical protein [Galactobacter valiniphilus]|uniref:hypothetical protein n=1 Tax=Galactobacter valiniphilus TaxID=2676122 RepID=UPI0037368D3F
MIRPARREPAEQAVEAPDVATPETLRFPPRERPTTIRRPARDAPFDLENEDELEHRAEEDRAASRQEAEREREAEEREAAIRQARASLAGQAAPPELASVVWEAHEAIVAAREAEADPDAERIEYVPIARESHGITSLRPIERVPASLYVAPYNLPERSPNPAQTPLDLVRRVLVSAVAVTLAVAGFVLLREGLTPALASGTSPLAPWPVAAFAWPVLGLAAVACAAHAWAPDQRSARRQRALGLPWLLGGLGGIAWAFSAAFGPAWLALPSSLLVLAGGWEGVRRLNLLTARTRRERWLTDVPTEALLGWGAFSVAWSLSATAAATGWIVEPVTLWSSLTLLACMIPVCVAGMSERGRLVPALAFGWGAVWLMVARLLGGWHDPILMVIAGIGGIIALLTALARRQEIGHNERLALQGLPTA